MSRSTADTPRLFAIRERARMSIETMEINENAFRMIGDDVLVRQVAPKDTYGSGLIFRTPDATEWPPEAVVLAVGPGRPRWVGGELVRIPPEVAVGDRVIFKRRPDTDLEFALDQFRLPGGAAERHLMLDGNPDAGKGDILVVLEP
jgi:co-chaperonin GroES (HSP10)